MSESKPFVPLSISGRVSESSAHEYPGRHAQPSGDPFPEGEEVLSCEPSARALHACPHPSGGPLPEGEGVAHPSGGSLPEGEGMDISESSAQRCSALHPHPNPLPE